MADIVGDLSAYIHLFLSCQLVLSILWYLRRFSFLYFIFYVATTFVFLFFIAFFFSVKIMAQY